MRMDISLREPKPGGEFYTFAISSEIDLDPLYDVAISPLQFTLLDDCDPAGKSEVVFFWRSPDNVFEEAYRVRFSTRASVTTTVAQFAWDATEVSAAADLGRPVMWFFEEDPFGAPAEHHSDHDPSNRNLVPGQTETVTPGILHDHSGLFFPDCYASAQYTITYTLRRYPDL
jgi:hypothetical protein